MKALKRSTDSKVANSLTPGGKGRIANSFGLPSGRAYSCPAATSVCESVCYAGKLEKIRPTVRNLLMHNWDLLREADRHTMYDLLVSMLTEFDAECDKWDAEKLFRIHWDGDFFSPEYVAAWAAAMAEFPQIRFWVYTRVDYAARILRHTPNLSLYFSGDSENAETAERMSALGVNIAMLGKTFDLAREALSVRAAKCPEQRGQIALAGACVACKICIKGNTSITFSISKK